ncbi:uncharacterized protein [Ptychodera flava]|uniref:uncharacterized protein n=1 Tax=Ptychodera flava TaxID=63121 RepID=UPI00396A2B71
MPPVKDLMSAPFCFLFHALIQSIRYLLLLLRLVVYFFALLVDFILMIVMSVIVLLEYTLLKVTPGSVGKTATSPIRFMKQCLERLFLTDSKLSKQFRTKREPGTGIETPRRQQPRRSCKSMYK